MELRILNDNKFLREILLMISKRTSLGYLRPACFLSIGFMALWYLLKSCKYFMPLGDDGVIYMWPAGYWMAQGSFLDFFKVAISSFLLEDHLGPIQNVLGYLSFLLSSDPAFILNIFAKVQFVVLACSAFLVIYELWKDHNRVLLFALFFVMNLPMTWRNMVFPIAYTPASIFSFISFYFFLRYLRTKTKKDFLFMSIFFVTGILTFEVFFVSFPLFLVFGLYDVWSQKQNSVRQKFFHMAKMGGMFAGLVSSYFLIHYLAQGTFMPGSRLGIFTQGVSPLSYYARMITATFSEWFFDIPKFVLSQFVMGAGWKDAITSTSGMPVALMKGTALLPLLLLGALGVGAVFCIFRFKLISKTAWLLIGAFCLQILFILFTGRYEDGMWTSVGIVLWMIIVDILYSALTRNVTDKETILKRVGYFILIVLPFLVVLNFLTNSFKLSEDRYGQFYRRTQAGYLAANEDADNIVITRLGEVPKDLSLGAFWIGNKIYHKGPGLTFYPDKLMLHVKNFYMESYPNPGNKDFESFRKLLKVSPGKNVVVLAEDQNAWTRFYLNASNRPILRVAPVAFDLHKNNRFQIHLFDLKDYSYAIENLRFVLKFDRQPKNVGLRYANKEIGSWSFLDDTTISFTTEDYSFNNELLVVGDEAHLLTMEVLIEGKKMEKDSAAPQTLSISNASSKDSCDFSYRSADGERIFIGSVDPLETKTIMPLVFGPMDFEYTTRNIREAMRQKGRVSFDPAGDKGKRIVVCPQR